MSADPSALAGLEPRRFWEQFANLTRIALGIAIVWLFFGDQTPAPPVPAIP